MVKTIILTAIISSFVTLVAARTFGWFVDKPSIRRHDLRRWSRGLPNVLAIGFPTVGAITGLLYLYVGATSTAPLTRIAVLNLIFWFAIVTLNLTMLASPILNAIAKWMLKRGGQPK